MPAASASNLFGAACNDRDGCVDWNIRANSGPTPVGGGRLGHAAVLGPGVWPREAHRRLDAAGGGLFPVRAGGRLTLWLVPIASCWDFVRGCPDRRPSAAVWE